MSNNRRRIFRRLYIKFRLWFRNKTKKIVEYDSEYQRRTCKFVEKMIRVPESELLYLPNKFKYYIKNGETYITISKNIVTITLDKSKYTEFINDAVFEDLTNKFNDKLLINKDRFKEEMYSKQSDILDYIEENTKRGAQEIVINPDDEVQARIKTKEGLEEDELK